MACLEMYICLEICYMLEMFFNNIHRNMLYIYLHMYIIYIYIETYVNIYIYIHFYEYICIYVQIYICIYICMFLNIHAYLACFHIFIFTCRCFCRYFPFS